MVLKWITNGPQADIIVTYANKDFASMGRSPTGFVSSFIIEKPTKDSYVGKVEEKLGIACFRTSA